MSELSRQHIRIWEKFTGSVTNTSSLIVSQNLRRKYLLITNISSTPIWLWFYDPSVANEGIYLREGGWSYEIDFSNLWVGDIHAVHAAAGTKLVSIVEGH